MCGLFLFLSLQTDRDINFDYSKLCSQYPISIFLFLSSMSIFGNHFVWSLINLRSSFSNIWHVCIVRGICWLVWISCRVFFLLRISFREVFCSYVPSLPIKRGMRQKISFSVHHLVPYVVKLFVVWECFKVRFTKLAGMDLGFEVDENILWTEYASSNRGC